MQCGAMRKTVRIKLFSKLRCETGTGVISSCPRSLVTAATFQTWQTSPDVEYESNV